MTTRFKLFVQPPFEDARPNPEVVAVSSQRGSLRAGPSDDLMYVVEPSGKSRPYGINRGPLGTPFLYLPPWRGKVHAPALPGMDGHFDHYRPSMPGFEAAHAFGCVRFTLDVWERYVGQPLVWHFRSHFDRLEISILPDWNNAQFGYGFLELGTHAPTAGRWLPFSLDFDVIAHEVGHAVIYSVLGVPASGSELPEYLGFQEAFSDCVSLIAAMHFPSVIENVLGETRGNLYLANRLSRFSEFSPHRQIRSASNTRTMAEFVNGWKNEHELSQPLTGAIFDSLVDIFHESLVGRGLIPPEIEALADTAEVDAAAEKPLQDAFDRAFARDGPGFEQALLDARDVVGKYLAETLWNLELEFLDYGRVAATMLAVDEAETGGNFGKIIGRNFRRRGIGRLRAGKRLMGGKDHAALRTSRTLRPADCLGFPRMSYREMSMVRGSISS